MNKLIGSIMLVAGFIYLILTPISVLIFFVFAIPATIILAFGIWFKELADLFFAGGAATRDIARSGLWLLDKGINKLKGK